MNRHSTTEGMYCVVPNTTEQGVAKNNCATFECTGAMTPISHSSDINRLRRLKLRVTFNYALSTLLRAASSKTLNQIHPSSIIKASVQW